MKSVCGKEHVEVDHCLITGSGIEGEVDEELEIDELSQPEKVYFVSLNYFSISDIWMGWIRVKLCVISNPTNFSNHLTVS